MGIRIQCLCIDARDPAAIASFWQSALGWRRTFEKEDEVVLEPSAGSGCTWTCGRTIRPPRSPGWRRSVPAGSASARARSAGWSWPTRRATSSTCCARSRPRNWPTA